MNTMTDETTTITIQDGDHSVTVTASVKSRWQDARGSFAACVILPGQPFAGCDVITGEPK